MKAQNKLDIPLESIFKYTIYLYKCVCQGRYLPFHQFLLCCLQHLVLPIEEKHNVYNNKKTSFNTYNYYTNYYSISNIKKTIIIKTISNM